MIHTSGTSNVGDKPITTGAVREFDDSANDVYTYEKEQEALEPYAQRTTELGVIDTGRQSGVKTIVIMSPIIYGNGTGLFNKVSIHTMYMKAMMKIGDVVVVGEGPGVWDHVHVQDLAELYRLVVLEILEKEGRDLPTGKKGFIFSGNGRHSWLEYSQHVADALYDEGVITQKTVTPLSLEEAGRILMPHLGFINDEATKEGLTLVAEGFTTNARTISNVARKLGWTPTRGEEAWKGAFRDDIKTILKSRK